MTNRTNTESRDRRSKMSIRIETTKEVTDDGRRGRRITEIGALRKDELPALYRESNKRPVCYLDMYGHLHYGDHHLGTRYIFYKGDWVEEKEFQTCLEYIRQASEHLQDVKRKLMKGQKTWSSEESFVI